MHFHGYEHLAKTALEDIQLLKPEEFSDARKIYEHYCGDDKQNQDFAAAFTSFCFLLKDNFDKAEQAINRATSRGMSGSNNLLKNSINNGLLSSLKDETYFYKKGLIKDETTYYPVIDGFEYGSSFHNACSQIPAKYQPILKRAIHYAFTKNKVGDDVSVTKKTLLYIPIQLMDPGTRDFRVTALSQQRSKYSHEESLTHSRQSVLKIAESLSIIFGKDQLIEGKQMEISSEPTASQKHADLVKSLSRRSFEHRAPRPVAQPVNENKSLMRELSVLAKTKAITPEEGRVYLWLHDMNANEYRVHKDAAHHFIKTEKAIVSIDDKVRRALDVSRSSVSLENLAVKR